MPNGRRFIAVTNNIDCHPCEKSPSVKCRRLQNGQPACLDFSADIVWRKIKKTIAKINNK
jgi:hypothetical protein